MFLGYQCAKVCEAFWYSKYFSFYVLSIDEDRQKFNSPTSKQIFSATNRNIKKASHTFVVHHLLIDIVQFVWSYVRAGRQVIQFSKIVSVLRLKACARLPLNQILKKIISSDSKFY